VRGPVAGRRGRTGRGRRRRYGVSYGIRCGLVPCGYASWGYDPLRRPSRGVPRGFALPHGLRLPHRPSRTHCRPRPRPRTRTRHRPHSHPHRLRRELRGAVAVHQEWDDVADALVVDGGVDGVAGGEGDAVELVQDGVLELLAGSGDDGDAADRCGARARPRHGDVDVDGGHRGARRLSGVLLFPLLVAAESRHRSLTRMCRVVRGRGVRLRVRFPWCPPPRGLRFRAPRQQDPVVHVLLSSLSARLRFPRHQGVTASSQSSRPFVEPAQAG
jgi:hypothetical protein